MSMKRFDCSGSSRGEFGLRGINEDYFGSQNQSRGNIWTPSQHFCGHPLSASLSHYLLQPFLDYAELFRDLSLNQHRGMTLWPSRNGINKGLIEAASVVAHTLDWIINLRKIFNNHRTNEGFDNDEFCCENFERITGHFDAPNCLNIYRAVKGDSQNQSFPPSSKGSRSWRGSLGKFRAAPTALAMPTSSASHPLAVAHELFRR